MPPPARSPAAGVRRRGALLPLAFLLLLLLLLLHLTSSPARSPNSPLLRGSGDGEPRQRGPCDYASGEWVPDDDDPAVSGGLRYDQTCREIFKGWNCLANGKRNGRELLRWRWRPRGCELPRLDPLRFLERHRNTSIGPCSFPFRVFFTTAACSMVTRIVELEEGVMCKVNVALQFTS
jgi:hypothetical protein